MQSFVEGKSHSLPDKNITLEEVVVALEDERSKIWRFYLTIE